MSVIQNAVSDFQSKLANGFLTIPVPEWKTTVFYKKHWSLKEQSPVNKLSAQGKQDEAMVEALIIRAKNEDGTSMFKRADKTELMSKVDPEIISRIIIEMNQDGDLTVEEAEKNS